MKKTFIILTGLLSAFSLQPSALGQGTAFTYQGRLNDGTNSATGSYDLQFVLFDAAGGGAQQGNALTNAATAISNGLFTVTLDFGNQFPGADRWLEIGVRTNGAGTFATLSPRQRLTSTPYAVQAGNASSAVVATTANSVAAVNITGVLGTTQIPNIDASKVTSGTLADAQLSANVALRAGGNYFSGDQSISGGALHLYANPRVQSTFPDWSSVFEFSDITGTAFRSFVGMDGLGLYGSPNQMYLGTYTSHPLSLFTGNQPRMTIDTVGNVGIGTSFPQRLLQVGYNFGDSEGMIRLSSSSSFGLNRNWEIGVPRDYLSTDGRFYSFVIQDADSPRDPVFLARWDTGYVGIGTTNPLAKLDVSGAVRATQFVGGGFVGDGSGLTNLPGTLPQLVTATAISGQPNYFYAFTNSSTSTITLPTNANVGDLIQIASLGSAGWQVQPNSGQTIKGFLASPGVTWISHPPSNRWLDVAASTDGMKLVAVPYIPPGGNYIHTSTDGGTNWIAQTNSPIRTWVSVASSADGTKLVAGTEGSNLYTSSDSGVTWTARAFPTTSWHGVASSSNGTRLAAVPLGGQIYISTDSGVTWIPYGPTTNWTSIACSADGSKLLAGGLNGAYISTDGGTNWITQTNYPKALHVASSADGATLLVSPNLGNRIYISTDSGANWNLTGPNINFGAVACSADGSRLLAAGLGGQLYTSIDRGANWIAGGPATNWTGVACSSDGARLVAAQQAGPIHISSGSVFTTAPGSSVTLQYAGNGVWQADNVQSASNLPSTIVTRDTSGNFSAGTITATAFVGNGSGLAGLNASQLTSGTLANSLLTTNVSLLGQTIDSSEITDGAILNVDINVGAAIAYSKLNLTNGIVNADINSNAAIADTKLATISTAGKVANSALSNTVSLLGQTIESSEITDGTISNIDISITAAIADTKLATISTAGKVADTALSANVPLLSGGKLNDAVLSANVSLLGASIDSSEITDGTISNVDISINAAIADTKLATISTAGKVANSALSNNVSLLGQTIESSEITDGTISNVDISLTAAIADTKLATISTAGKVSDSALSSNVARRSGGNNFSNDQIITNAVLYIYGNQIVRPSSPGWAATTEWAGTNDNSGVRAIIGTAGFGLTFNTNYMFIGTYSPHPVNFFMNGIQEMTIDTTGNVGIGTSTPASRLTVSTPSSTPGLEHTDGTRRLQTYLDSSGGWLRTASTNDKLILASGSLGIAGVTIIQTNTLGVGLEQYVGINELNPQYHLDVFGDLHALRGFKPGGGSWSVASDERLKKNIRPLAGALDKLLALHGVNFEYIDPEKIRELSGERMGLVAQEVEKVFPDWVETGKDGYKRVTVRGMEALVPEALRELRDEQNAKIAEIEKEKDALKDRLEKLERLISEKNGAAK